MPLFYFDTSDRVHDDVVGVDLQSVGEAKLEAIRLLAGIMNDNPSLFIADETTVTVCDPQKLILFRVSTFISDAPALG